MTNNDRDTLELVIREAARINDGGLLEGSHLSRIAYLAAERILARWRLVPVDSSDPEPPHVHRWEEISSAEQIENGAHVFYCGGFYGCGKNDLQYDRA